MNKNNLLPHLRRHCASRVVPYSPHSKKDPEQSCNSSTQMDTKSHATPVASPSPTADAPSSVPLAQPVPPPSPKDGARRSLPLFTMFARLANIIAPIKKDEVLGRVPYICYVNRFLYYLLLVVVGLCSAMFVLNCKQKQNLPPPSAPFERPQNSRF